MSRYCLYCGKEITGLHANAKYCPECRKICYREKEREYKREARKRKAYLSRSSKKEKDAATLKKISLKERRDNINKLIQETGMHYGEVAYYYDSGKIDELYKRAEYLKSIGRIKSNDGEHKIVKSCGGKLKGGYDYFMISTE